MKDEFISVVSHELRTPLTSIKGSLGLLVSETAGDLPEKVRQMLAISYQNSERLELLINELLDMSKIQSAESSLHLEPLNVSELIDKAVVYNQGYAEKYGVSLLCQQTDNLAIYVKGDENRLIQALSNFISNAIKYSPKEAPVVISASNNDNEVRVSISDSGPGIPLEFQDRLFDKFTQADSSDRRQVGGTGLGMTITKAIIEKHGGKVGFDSTPGQGATFYFELPITGFSAPGSAPA